MAGVIDPTRKLQWLEFCEQEASPLTERTALYRIWGAADLLLYIGVSKDFGARWKQHAKQQPWWDEMKRLTVDEWFDSRDEAEDAETAAIRAEKPKYNIQKTGSKSIQLTDESLALWVGDGDLIEQIRRIVTGSHQNAALVRLMVVALLEGYTYLPGGHELEMLGAKACVSKSSVYRVVREARMKAVTGAAALKALGSAGMTKPAA